MKGGYKMTKYTVHNQCGIIGNDKTFTLLGNSEQNILEVMQDKMISVESLPVFLPDYGITILECKI